MKQYLLLQVRMLHRQLKDFGVHPLLGYATILTLFSLISYFYIPYTVYSPYVYSALAVSAVSLFSQPSRNDFLKYCFSTRHYYLIRNIENQIILIPFSIFLLLYYHFLLALAIHMLVILFTFFSFNTRFSFAMPTPFYRFPFEFSTGFRTTFHLFLVAFLLTFMGISVDNFNLCIASLLLVFFVMLFFYINPEPEYYVWNFSLSPRGFLLHKTRIALLYASLISSPVFIATCLYFPQYLIIVIVAQLTGYLYLITMLMAKYSNYPRAISFPSMVVIMVSVLFPPITLILIPFFYNKALSKLQSCLS